MVPIANPKYSQTVKIALINQWYTNPYTNNIFNMNLYFESS